MAAVLFSCVVCVVPAAERVVVSERHDFRLVQVGTAVRNPWSIAFLPDGSALVSERGGALYRLRGTTLTPIRGVPEVAAHGQGGLLDIEPHPQFASNRTIFFSFTQQSGRSYGTAVARARLVEDELRGVRVIFRMNRFSSSKLHFGSRISFLPDGTLLVTLGERGERERAQDLRDHGGSVVRIDQEGGVPRDNPFADGSGLPEIFSYGHRNPQGLAVHPTTGVAWSTEHGPRGGDELNIVRRGVNYGWPVISYGREYATNRQVGVGTAAPGMEQPIVHWTPSIAVAGMTFYTGSRFAEWRDNLFVAALAARQLRRLEIAGDRVRHQEVLLQGAIGRIRDVKQDTKGYLWLLTDESRGGIYRLEPIRR